MTLASLFESIQAPWGHFQSTLDALFMSKNRLGCQRCPKGRQHHYSLPHLGTFWELFSKLFRIFDAKSVYLTHVVFFVNFWGALSAHGDGLICNPSTPAQSKHTFHFSHVFSNKFSEDSNMGPFSSNFCIKKILLCEQMCFKNCFKIRCPPRLKQVSIHTPGGSWRSSLACALYREETLVRAAVEALFEILAEKSEVGSKFA